MPSPETPPLETSDDSRFRRTGMFEPGELSPKPPFDIKKRLSPTDIPKLQAALEEAGVEPSPSREPKTKRDVEQIQPVAEILRALDESIQLDMTNLERNEERMQQRQANPMLMTQVPGLLSPEVQLARMESSLVKIHEDRDVAKLKLQWLEQQGQKTRAEIRKALDAEQEQTAASYRDALAQGAQQHGTADVALGLKLTHLKQTLRAFDELDRALQERGV